MQTGKDRVFYVSVKYRREVLSKPCKRNVYKQTKQSWSEVTSLSVPLRKPDFALWDPSNDVLDGSPGPE